MSFIRTSLLGAQNTASAPSSIPLSMIVFAAVAYPALLCFMHTHFFPVVTATVGTTEFLIYLACLIVLLRPVRVEFVVVATLVTAYLLLLSLFRGAVEIKSFRDVMIPILFYWLGRSVIDSGFADKLLRVLIWVVLIFGFFELFFLDWYSYLFNIFSYYHSQGINTRSTNFVSDSALNVNGMRPDGIGRTILPDLLGRHRVSSIFLEPVSLGNFATVVAAWGLAKSRAEWKSAAFFVVAGIIMISLSDSRYGIGAVSLMALLRAVPIRWTKLPVSLMPLVCISALLLFAVSFNGPYTDSVFGRLYMSGKSLLGLDASMLFGINSTLRFFYDMGYPYTLTRFGLLLAVFLWFAIWMVKMRDENGERFRIFVAIYITLLLSVSGTSLFALKSAGILWFLFGSCAATISRQFSPTLASESTAQPLSLRMRHAT